MNFNFKKVFLTMAVALITSFNLVACTTNKMQTIPEKNAPIKENNMMNKDTDNITENNTVTDKEIMNQSKKIEEEINKVKGVQNSKVLITEKRALVGLKIDPNIQGTNTDKLKSNVEKIVKKIDSKIQTVAISVEPDVFERISDIGKGFTNGKPLSTFGSEIEEIFKRIIPSNK